MTLATLFLLGFGAGLFIVPLQAFIQYRSPKERLGEILAASALLNWSGVLVSAGMTYAVSSFLTLPAGAAFVLLGYLTMGLMIIAIKVLPDFLVRFLVLLLTRVCYRIRVIGRENIPLSGPALLVANHVTWVDALLLSAMHQRRIRFVMERNIYERPVLNPLFRLMKVIPVSAADSRKQLVKFLQDSRSALNEGYIVCIFAEGAITRNGMIGEFRSGFERIVKGTEYPVVPAYIGGGWGSIFSYAHGRLMSRLPLKFPYPVTIIFGRPLSSVVSPFVVLYARGSGDSETFHRVMSDSPLPNLWKPDRNHYLEVPALPVLGTGKLDIKGIRQLALQAFGGA